MLVILKIKAVIISYEAISMACCSKSVHQQKISEFIILAINIIIDLNFKKLLHLTIFYYLPGILLLKAVMINMFFNKVRLKKKSRDYIRILKFQKLSNCMYMKILHI